MGRQNKKRLLWFGVFTLAFLIPISIWYIRSRNSQILLFLMCTPAVSVILTRLVTHEGTKDLYLKPRFRKNWKWYLAVYLLPPLLAYGGAAVYFLIFPGDFDMLHSTYAVSSGVWTTKDYLLLLLQTIPLAILVNPVMGLIQCFGEEFAWRGYLLPKLCERMSTGKAVLLTGAVWGIWHAPIIAVGYNYGTEHPAAGIFAMVLFCMVLGAIEGFVFLKTGSVWPAVLLHAALNGMDLWSPSDLLMSKTPNLFIGPDPTGVIGGIGFLAAAVICLLQLRKMKRE